MTTRQRGYYLPESMIDDGKRPRSFLAYRECSSVDLPVLAHLSSSRLTKAMVLHFSLVLHELPTATPILFDILKLRTAGPGTGIVCSRSSIFFVLAWPSRHASCPWVRVVRVPRHLGMQLLPTISDGRILVLVLILGLWSLADEWHVTGWMVVHGLLRDCASISLRT